VILLRIVGLAIATGFCGSAALALRRAWRLENGSVGILVFLLFFTAVQSLVVLAAGLTGTLSFWPMTLATGAGWALLQWRKPPAGVLFALPVDRTKIALLALAAAGLVSLIIKAFCVGPATGDVLQYHLPKVAEWIQAGRFVWHVNHDPRSWFSAGFELIETWWVVFLHHDRLIELGGIQMAVLAAASVYTLAESMDARPGLAAVVYLFLPAVLLGATSCGNDLAVSAFILAGYALVAAGAPRPLQVFAILLALSVKATGAFAAVGIIAFAFFRDRPPKLPRSAAVALTAAGVLLSGFWYVRNAAVMGHPLYPARGGTWVVPDVDIESLQQTIQVLPSRLVDKYPYESTSPRSSAWGWAMLPLGLPALLLVLRQDRRFRLLALSFLIGAGVTLTCVWLQDTSLRFVLWFPALLAIALARQKSPAWAAAAMAACLINLVATAVPYELRHSRHIRVPAAIPPHEPVACVFDQAASCYRLYNPDFSRRVFYPRSMDELRRSGAKWVYLEEMTPWAAPIRDWPLIERKFYEVR
jgi:hypothetical protein